MSLSITNTNHISQQEIAAIAHCNLDTHLIVLKRSAEVGSKITTIAKSEVTCWQLFIRYFGLGNLTDIEVSLAMMTTNLNRFNWAAGATLSPHSIHHQAYLKTCMLANKALYSKQDETLLNNVSMETIQKGMEFTQYKGTQLQHRHLVTKPFHWNPCMQVKHIRALLSKQFQGMNIRIEDEYHQPFHPNTNASQQLLYRAHIYIEQRLEDPATRPEQTQPNRGPQTTRRV